MLLLAGRTPHQYACKIFGRSQLFAASALPTNLRQRDKKELTTIRTLNLRSGVGNIRRQAFITLAFEIYGRHAAPILILANDISFARTHFT